MIRSCYATFSIMSFIWYDQYSLNIFISITKIIHIHILDEFIKFRYLSLISVIHTIISSQTFYLLFVKNLKYKNFLSKVNKIFLKKSKMERKKKLKCKNKVNKLAINVIHTFPYFSLCLFQNFSISLFIFCYAILLHFLK